MLISLTRSRLAKAIAGLAIGACAGLAQANPRGPQVVHGQVQFKRPGGGVLNVTSSPNAIINWKGFSIAQGEITRFLQQNASSAVLNRVIGQNPSAILGQLLSNGRVFLINPNGIVFGAGARIDTQGLIASTLNLSNEDFLAGRYRFEAGATAGGIENHGFIRSGPGGEVVLIAPSIENSGIIQAPDGRLVLAAGRKVTFTSLDAGGVQFEVQAPSDSVLNIGALIAERGTVGAFAGTLTNTGRIEARGVTTDAAGNIVLTAKADVTVTGSSVVDAGGTRGGRIVVESETGTARVAGRVSARGETGNGGDVTVTGEQVELAAAVDASGATGGGTARIGGDWQGRGTTRTARSTVMAATASVDVSAREHGDGGMAVVWADDSARVYGSANLVARGGLAGGDGGRIETSGKRYLQVGGAPDASAPAGAGGLWLLDPIDVVISSGVGADVSNGGITNDQTTIDADTIVTALSNELIVEIRTDNAGAGAGEGDITVTSGLGSMDLGAAVDGHLILRADQDVIIDAGGNGIAASSGGFHLTLIADEVNDGLGNVDIGAPIDAGGGDVTIDAGFDVFIAEDITAGAVAVTASRDINVDDVITIGAASSLSADRNIHIAQAIDLGGSTMSLTADAEGDLDGIITFDNNLLQDVLAGETLTTDAVATHVGSFGETAAVHVNGGTWNVTGGDLSLGVDGNGTVIVSNVGQVDVTLGDLRVGSGIAATGLLNILGGGQVFARSGATAGANGATGTVGLGGAGSQLEVSGDTFHIGRGAGSSGQVSLTTGAILHTLVGGTYAAILADDAGSTGTVTVDGDGSLWLSTNSTIVGDLGVGTVTISNGARFDSAPIFLGLQANASMSTLQVLNGAVLDTQTDPSSVVIGGSVGAKGQLLLDGGTWLANGIDVGDAGEGTLNVSNASTVDVTGTLTIGKQSTGVGSVQVNAPLGAGSNWTQNGNDVVVGKAGDGALTVFQASDFDNAGGNVYVARDAGSIGALQLLDAGTFHALNVAVGVQDVAGTVQGGDGTVFITDGVTLTVADLVNAGTVAGIGTIGGNVTAASTFANTVSPGHPTGFPPELGVLNITGDFTANDGTTLAIQLGGTLVSEYDSLLVGGDAALDGTLVVTITDEAMPGYQPSIGNSFQVVTAGSVTDSGISLVEPPGVTFDPSFVNGGDVTLLVDSAASIVTWILAGGGSWLTPANWSTGVLPGVGDEVVIPDIAGVGADQTITLSGGVAQSFESLFSEEHVIFTNGADVTIAGNADLQGDLTVHSGSTLSVGAGLDVDGDLDLDESQVTVTGGDVTVLGDASFTGDAMAMQAALVGDESNALITHGITTILGAGLTLDSISWNNFGTVNSDANGVFLTGTPGLVTNEAGATYNAPAAAALVVTFNGDGVAFRNEGTFNGSVDLGAGAGFVNAGSFNWDTDDLLLNGGDFTNLAGATFSVVDSGDALLQASFGASFDNQGTFTKQDGATGTTTVIAILDNSGTLNAGVGTLVFEAGLVTSSGTLNVDGVLRNVDGNTLRLAGTPTVTGTGSIEISDAADLDVTVAATLPAGLTVDLVDGGFINNAHNLTIDGTFNWSGDVQGQPGTFVTSGTTHLDGGTLTGTAWNNTGAVSWTGSAFDFTLTDAAAVVTNEAGGTFAQGMFSDASLDGGGSFVNEGQFTKSGAGTLTLNVPFTNNGTVEVESGSLQFSTFEQSAAAAVLSLLGGDVASASGFDIESGSLLGAGNIDSGAGSVVIGATATLSPGTSPGVLTIAGQLDFEPGATLVIEVDGTATPGTDFDRVTADSVDIDGIDLVIDGTLSPSGGETVSPIVCSGGAGCLTGTPASVTVVSSTFFDVEFATDVDELILDNFLEGLVNLWTGSGGDLLWSNAANWDRFEVPQADQVARIDSAAGTVVINAAVSDVSGIESDFPLQVSGPGSIELLNSGLLNADLDILGGLFIVSGTLDLFGADLSVDGGTLDIGGAVNVSGGGNLRVVSGNVTGSGTASVNGGTLLLAGGVLGNTGAIDVTGAGSLFDFRGGVLGPGAALTVATDAALLVADAGNKDIDARTLDHRSTTGASLIAGGTLRPLNGASIVNAGTLNLDTDGSPVIGGATADGQFDNQDRLIATGSGAAAMHLPFANSGTVDLRDNAVLEIAGDVDSAGGTHSGDFLLTGTAGLDFQDGVHTLNGDLVGDGDADVIVRGTALVLVNGAYAITGTTELGGAGGLGLGGAVTTGGLVMNAGTVRGPGNLTLTDTFNFNGGTLEDLTTTVAAGGLLQIGGGVLDGAILVNESVSPGGGLINGGNDLTVRNDAVIDNRGLFVIAPGPGDGIVNDTGAVDGSAFVNSGTVEFTSTGVSEVQMELANAGIVDVNGAGGTLHFSHGGTNVGTLRATAGTLDLNATAANGSGEMVYATGTRFEGAGVLLANLGTQTFSGNGIVVDTPTTLAFSLQDVAGAGSIDNQGTVLVSDATLVDVDIDTAGTLLFIGASTVRAGAGISGAGDVEVQSGTATFEVGGAYAIDGMTVVAAGATAQMDRDASGGLDLRNATLDGAGSYQVTGAGNLLDAAVVNLSLSIASAADVTVQGGGVADLGQGSIEIENGGVMRIDGAALDIDTVNRAGGLVEVLASAAQSSVDTAFENRAGATLRLVHDATNDAVLVLNAPLEQAGTLELTGGPGGNRALLNALAAPAAIVNTGTIRSLGTGSGVNGITGDLDNAGLLDVQRDLALNNSGATFDTTAGTVNVASGATLHWNVGEVLLSGGTSFSGSGVVAVGPGDPIVDVSGTVILPAGGPTFDFTGAAVAVTGSGTLRNEGAGSLLLDDDSVAAAVAVVNTGTLKVLPGPGAVLNGAFTNSGDVIIEALGNPASLFVNGAITNTGSIILDSDGGSGSAGSLVTIGAFANAGVISARNAVIDPHTMSVTTLTSTGSVEALDGDLDLSLGVFDLNAGAVRADNGVLTATGGNFNWNGGAVEEVNGGTVDLSGTAVAFGGTDIVVAAPLSLDAPTFNGGRVTVVTGGDLQVSGLATFASGSELNVQDGMATLGDIDLLSGAELNLTGGSLEFDYLFVDGATATFGDGMLVPGGAIADVQAGGTLVFNGSAPQVIHLAIGNSGTVRYENAAGVTHNSNFNNRGDGVVRFVGNTSLGGDTTINNDGTLFKTGGGTTVIDAFVQSAGSINFASGVLRLADGADLGGNVNGSGSAELQLADGASLLGLGGPTFDGGTVRVLGGSLDGPGLNLAGGARVIVDGGVATPIDVGALDVQSGSRIDLNTGSLRTVSGLTNAGTIRVASGGVSSGSLSNTGSITAGNGSISASSGLTNNGSMTVTGTGGVSAGSGFTNTGRIDVGEGNVAAGTGFTNSGTVNVLDGNVTSMSGFTNTGSMTLTAGSVDAGGGLTNSGGSINAAGGGVSAGGNITNSGGPIGVGSGGITALGGTISNAGTINLRDDGNVTASTLTNTGTLRKTGGAGTSTVTAALANQGTVQVNSGTLAFPGGLTQNAGFIGVANGATLSSSGGFVVNGGIVSANGNLQGGLTNNGGGRVDLNGTINGDVANNNGILSAGQSPGTLVINGNLTQGADGVLLVEIGGLQDGQYDVIDVNGTANLDGALVIQFPAEQLFPGSLEVSEDSPLRFDPLRFDTVNFVGDPLRGFTRFEVRDSVRQQVGLGSTSSTPLSASGYVFDLEPAFEYQVAPDPVRFSYRLKLVNTPFVQQLPDVTNQVVALTEVGASKPAPQGDGGSQDEEEQDGEESTATASEEDGDESAGERKVLVCS